MAKRPVDLDLAEVVQALATRQLTAEDYARDLLDQESRLRSLNVMASLHWEDVLAEARAADEVRRRGESTGRLGGVPLLVKDNFDTAGRPTTAGTAGLAQHLPRANAPVLQKLLDAGAIVFGKTNLHELAFGITCNNLHTGPVHNPYDPAMIPGGSSGGTAAGVAARIAPAGLGSDTGGSVRIPAALCGVVGFRPTTARYPSTGVVPISHSFDTPGLLSRTVADAWILDGVIAPASTASGEPTSPHSLEGLRLGIPSDPFWTGVASEVADVMDGALKELQGRGVVLVDVELPGLPRLVDDSGFTIVLFELLPDMESYLRASGTELKVDDLVRQISGPDVRRSFEAASTITESSYSAARAARRRLQAAYTACFRDNNLDALAFPTTPLTAAPIGLDETIELDGVQVPTFATFIRNTFPGAIAGIPGLSLPAGISDRGLPIGLELDGPAASDGQLLQIGMEIEREVLPPLAPPRVAS
jgi:mandelamide amidase